MYVLVENLNNNQYKILDTEDMSVDVYDKYTLITLFQDDASLRIYGLSELALQVDLNIGVVLRIYDRDGSVKDYDGYTLGDGSSDYDTLRYDIIDVMYEREVIDNPDVLDIVIQACKNTNKQYYSESKLTLSQSNKAYSVYTVGESSYTVKDSVGNLYTCDAFSGVYIGVVEGCGIEGANITFDGTEIGNNYYSTITYLKSLLLASTIKSVKSTGSTIIRDEDCVCVSYNSIEKVFSGVDALCVGYDVPLFNIFRTVQKLDQSCLDFIPEMHNIKAVSFSNKTLIFSNGFSLKGLMEIAKLYRLINFESSSLKEEVNTALERHNTKAKMLDKSFDLSSALKFSKVVNSSCSVELPNVLVNDIRNTDICAINMPFGNIHIESNSPFDWDGGTYKTLWLTRISNVGSLGFDFKSNKMIVAPMREFNSTCIYNETFSKCLDYAKYNKIAYYDNNIIPLCATRLSWDSDEDRLIIWIACLCLNKCSSEGYPTTGFFVYNIPLVLTQGRFTQYSDVWVYNCLFQTIKLSDGVVKHLGGDTDSVDMLALFPSQTLKKNRDMLKYATRNNTAYFKKLRG